jgi:hypothetical protein
MKPIGSMVATSNFYDRLNGPKNLFLVLAVLPIITIFLISSFCWSHDVSFLLLCCLLVPAILLGLPRIVRSALLAYRGWPALSISEFGIWMRSWSYLGWISWNEVASVEIINGRAGIFHGIEIHLRDKEFARLAGHDRASVMLARAIGALFSVDSGQNMLPLIDSRQLTSSWEDLMTTLDPILAANGVAKSEKTSSRLD